MSGGCLEVNILNLFEAVKENVNLKRAAEFYGLEMRNGMALCIFHNEKTPSMKLYDDHFYCFGCHKHGDVTDLVAKLLNLSPLEAAKQIAHDFGISYDYQKDDYKPSNASVLAKIKREHEKAKKKHAYGVLCNYFQLLNDWRKTYFPKSDKEEPHPLFVKALTEMAYVEYLINCVSYGSKEEKADIINDKSGQLAKIENELKLYGTQKIEKEMTI